MKKLLVSIIGLLVLSTQVMAEGDVTTQNVQSAWQPELVGNLNLSQSEYDNWASGGEDSIVWQGTVDGKISFNNASLKWEQIGKVQYGQTRLAGDSYKKSVDQVVVEENLYYKWKTSINPFASVKWETQFTDTYDYTQLQERVISGFMDPGYLTESLGLGYQIEPWFKTRLGFAAKQTFADRFAAVYSDDQRTEELETIKSEAGLESVTSIKWAVMKNITMTSSLTLFSNLKTFDQVDIKWENHLAAKINSIISVNVNLDIVYDKDISTVRQLKEVLSLGFTYVLI